MVEALDNKVIDSENVMEKQEQSDYDYSRETYKEIIKNGRESILEAMEVARESGHPRAYEVLSKLFKDTGDVTDKLMDLNKKRRDIKEPARGQTLLPPGSTTNHVYIGSTSDLQKMIQDADTTGKTEVNLSRKRLEKDITPDIKYEERR